MKALLAQLVAESLDGKLGRRDLLRACLARLSEEGAACAFWAALPRPVVDDYEAALRASHGLTPDQSRQVTRAPLVSLRSGGEAGIAPRGDAAERNAIESFLRRLTATQSG